MTCFCTDLQEWGRTGWNNDRERKLKHNQTERERGRIQSCSPPDSRAMEAEEAALREDADPQLTYRIERPVYDEEFLRTKLLHRRETSSSLRQRLASSCRCVEQTTSAFTILTLSLLPLNLFHTEKSFTLWNMSPHVCSSLFRGCSLYLSSVHSTPGSLLTYLLIFLHFLLHKLVFTREMIISLVD